MNQNEATTANIAPRSWLEAAKRRDDERAAMADYMLERAEAKRARKNEARAKNWNGRTQD